MIENKLARLDQRIQRLKKRKEKIYTQIALAYLKETEKIFGKAFSLELILEMLNHLWTFSSEIQKEEWKKHKIKKVEKSEGPFHHPSSNQFINVLLLSHPLKPYTPG